MLEKYARGKTEYFKIFSRGFAVGGLGGLYKVYVGHDQSCDILGRIKDKSKFDDNYYTVYRDLISQTKVDFFNFKTLVSFDNLNYKGTLLSCLTCGITSLFSGISYDNLSDNIFALGVSGGVMNAIAMTIITGHTHGTDFVFGMIASMVGVQIMREVKEFELEDDILHTEI